MISVGLFNHSAINIMKLAILFAIACLAPFARAGGNEKGIAFLEENAKKEGVIVLPSGLQ